MADLSLNDVEHLLADYAEPTTSAAWCSPSRRSSGRSTRNINGDGERIGRRDNTWQGQLAGAFADVLHGQ